MVKATLRLIVLFLFTQIPFLSYSAIFTAQSSGSWDDPATWGEVSAIPGINDDVIIDSYEVSLYNSSTINIQSLTITNLSGSGFSGLILDGTITMNISGDLQMFSYNENREVYLNLASDVDLNVLGSLLMERTADNSHNNLFQITLTGTSQVIVQGDFNFNYKNGGNENQAELIMSDSSSFTVNGTVTIIQEDGRDLKFDLFNNSSFIANDSLIIESMGGNQTIINAETNALIRVEKFLGISNSGSSKASFDIDKGATAMINGNVFLNSAATGQVAELHIHGTGSVLDLNDGDVYLKASAEETIEVKISGTSKLNLEGNIIRESIFGAVNMTNNAQLVLDGNSSQNIPQTVVSGAGVDIFALTNIFIENPNGVSLTEDLTMTKDLTLTDGILNTSDTTLLILDDGANINGGSASSYINGPVLKRGTHDGTSFLFPVGSNGTYAPIEIEAITNVNLEYTAEYIGCPPPIGAITEPLKAINETGFWTLDRSDGQQVGNIILHWNDASAKGITDLTSLVVTYYDGSSGWFALGQDNVTGGIGVGASGSLQNDIGCPPPIGVSMFGLGSTDLKENALPVELFGFKARRANNNLKVALDWYTSSEENSNRFVVQKSYDGINFQDIGSLPAAGNSTETLYYSMTDDQPESGNNYYRLIQIDMNERMTFSGLANVFVKVNDEIPIVYPNPVRDQLKIFSKDLKNQREVMVTITDINGQSRYRGWHPAQNNLLYLAVQGLNINEPGLYFLTYKGKGNATTVEIFRARE